ncbi:hypothetical protein GOP47_0020983 [Adiantum capillus-veneris]|uniref:Ketoreductase domain-containing protein n=1 Tax=Adiantum capillus-veneris TaxID=13818 RepID=A0A9D4Z6M2_ADICA|nr:hypothetical protein GOP47_0020983 [Adiantum capillus-veneris]
MEARWSLKGRTALVTGATRGIGRAIAEELAQLGASVYVCARSEPDLKQRLEEWNDLGLAISGSVCDVSSYPSCEQLLTKVSEHFQGKLHILVLNAARIGVLGPILEVSVEDMASTLRTNFESSVHLSCLAHPLLKASREGSIVFISSIAGTLAHGPIIAIYHSTKGALNQLTKNLALEWAKDGIRVNTVAPGFTETDLANSLGSEILDAAKIRTPMRRLGEVHEIAPAVAFLCLPCSSFTTGTILTIDGGISCHNSVVACSSIEQS